MPPPGSYYDIASVPFSHTFTQADFNGGTYGGVANQLWLRRVTSAQVGFGIFTDKGGTFKPDTTIYESDGSTVVLADASVSNLALRAIVPGGTYYIKIVRHGGGASNFDFTTQADERPTDADVLPLTVGQYLINDDTSGFPATVLNADGTIAGYLTTIPAGETATFLPTGESLWHDRYGMLGPANQMALFDADLTFVASIDLSLGFDLPSVTHSDTDFFVIDRATGEVWKVTTAGVPTDLGAVIPTSGTAVAGAADADGAILYWVEDLGSAAVHRYDLLAMSALADLNTIPGMDTSVDALGTTPNNHPGDLILQPDGTFVTWYIDDSAGDSKLIHLDVDGSLLNAFSFGAGSGGGGINHLFSVSDADHIGVWLFTDGLLDVAQIGIVDLATGLIADDFTTPTFSAGIGFVADDATLHAPSASCTIFGIGLLQGGGGDDDEGDEVIGPLLVIHMPREVSSFEDEPT